MGVQECICDKCAHLGVHQISQCFLSVCIFFLALYLFTSILHLREIHDLELNYTYLPSVAVIQIPKDLASKEII